MGMPRKIYYKYRAKVLLSYILFHPAEPPQFFFCLRNFTKDLTFFLATLSFFFASLSIQIHKMQFTFIALFAVVASTVSAAPAPLRMRQTCDIKSKFGVPIPVESFLITSKACVLDLAPSGI
jgi:hypothetical protein